jgi:hypothetical protein
MKQITISFPPALEDKAKQAASNDHMSFAAFVRLAVAEKLRRQGATQHVKSA